MVPDAAAEQRVGEALVVAAVSAAAREQTFFERTRHFWGHSGYTWLHLPVRKDRAPLLKAEDAREASFAARMAFSSFWTRPPLR